jgi:hypothetical protein
MADEAREVPYPEVEIGDVRSYAAGRANASSVRETARQIGIGHTSLEKFLNGARPFAKNRSKLCEWYLREHRVHPLADRAHAAREEAGPRVENGAALIEALVGELSGASQTEARMRITTALAQGYRRMGAAVPDWLYRR